MAIDIGHTILIDGTAFTVESFKGHSARATHADEARAVWFDSREAVEMAPTLWGLPGRIEPKPAPPEGAVVVDVAVAEGGTP